MKIDRKGIPIRVFCQSVNYEKNAESIDTIEFFGIFSIASIYPLNRPFCHENVMKNSTHQSVLSKKYAKKHTHQSVLSCD
jgi:hypothetical protein